MYCCHTVSSVCLINLILHIVFIKTEYVLKGERQNRERAHSMKCWQKEFGTCHLELGGLNWSLHRLWHAIRNLSISLDTLPTIGSDGRYKSICCSCCWNCCRMSDTRLATCCLCPSPTSHLTSHISHLTSHISHLTSGISHLTSHISNLASIQDIAADRWIEEQSWNASDSCEGSSRTEFASLLSSKNDFKKTMRSHSRQRELHYEKLDSQIWQRKLFYLSNREKRKMHRFRQLANGSEVHAAWSCNKLSSRQVTCSRAWQEFCSCNNSNFASTPYAAHCVASQIDHSQLTEFLLK